MQASAILDDFRRDFAFAPVVCAIGGAGDTALAQRLRRVAVAGGHVLADALSPEAGGLPHLWLPAAHVGVSPDAAAAPLLPGNALRVLVGSAGRPPPGWDRCLSAARPHLLLSRIASEARAHHLSAIAAEAAAPPPPACKISAVVCTYRRAANLARALASLAAQEFPAADHEVLVVNNDPADLAPARVVAQARGFTAQLRLVQCPFPGLSFARNAGVAEARGQIVSFLDDDATAPPDWLAQVWRTFETHPEAGVVGGSIVLDVPGPRPRWLKPGWEHFWSQHEPRFTTATAVADWWEFPWGANWSARRRVLLAMGGFRTRYGRRSGNAAGGEEIVAACLARALGHAVVVSPAVRVVHTPDPDRFTLGHVWGRTLAALREEYRWQRDGYVPRDMHLPKLARAAIRSGRASLRRGLAAHQRLEHVMKACAEASLLIPLLRERWSSRV